MKKICSIKNAEAFASQIQKDNGHFDPDSYSELKWAYLAGWAARGKADREYVEMIALAVPGDHIGNEEIERAKRWLEENDEQD